jgi:PadR family transcriptional regulator PadR
MCRAGATEPVRLAPGCVCVPAGVRSGEATYLERGATMGPLSATDFHVLMVLAEGPSYGYAIMKAVEDHSGGAISPEIGAMYRVLSRLVAEGWVEDTKPPKGAKRGTRGLPRRYYALTRSGRAVARAEARRLARVVALAGERDLLPEGGAR